MNVQSQLMVQTWHFSCVPTAGPVGAVGKGLGSSSFCPQPPTGCETAGACAYSGWAWQVDTAARFSHGSCAGGLEVFCQETFCRALDLDSHSYTSSGFPHLLDTLVSLCCILLDP